MKISRLSIFLWMEFLICLFQLPMLMSQMYYKIRHLGNDHLTW
jgi:hypothetical protein